MKISKKSIFTSLCALALVVGVAVFVPSDSAMAQIGDIQDGVNSIGGGEAPSFMGLVRNGVNALLFLIGAVSVVMIIYGGFKYVTSAGDTSAVSSAKNTILYAVVGLVVALAAYAIASFVIGAINGSSASTEAGRATGNAARDAADAAIDGVNNRPSQPSPYGSDGPNP